MPPPAEAEIDVEAAKAEVAAAEQRLTGFRQKREADELHDKIMTNNAVIDILAPDGLRAKKLGHVLELFNTAQLGRLSLAAGWNQVTVDAEMTFAYGGRPYALLFDQRAISGARRAAGGDGAPRRLGDGGARRRRCPRRSHPQRALFDLLDRGRACRRSSA